jgi:hypothetical protein
MLLQEPLGFSRESSGAEEVLRRCVARSIEEVRGEDWAVDRREETGEALGIRCLGAELGKRI